MILLTLNPRELLDVCMRALWRGASPKERRRIMQRKRRTPPGKRLGTLSATFDALEPRALLSITAGNASYTASTATELSVPAPGLLAYCTDSNGYQMSAVLVSGPSSVTVNSDGSFTCSPQAVGRSTFEYKATDAYGGVSNIATVTINAELGISSSADSTKIAVDTIDVSRQILSDPFGPSITSPLPAGGSGGTIISPEPADGAPATAHNLSLEYNSIAAAPDQVLEGDFGLAMNPAVTPPETLSVSGTFNGTATPTTYVSTQGLGVNPTIHVAVQVSTAGLATGHYPYTLTLGGSSLYAPAIFIC